MVVSPRSASEYRQFAEFLRHRAGVVPSEDLRMIVWFTGGRPKLVVGFNSFVGKTCQMHVAMESGFRFTPRAMLKACFSYAFVMCGIELLLGVVKSSNEAAMKYDQHLGFKELYRLPGLAEDDSDLVFFGMRKSECRFLKGGSHGR